MGTLKKLMKMNIRHQFLLMKAKTHQKKYKELWNKIRDLIRSITNNSDNYNEKYMKMKFNSNDDSALKKTLEHHNMILVVRSVFMKAANITRKFCQRNVCINYKCQNTIELMCGKELMLIETDGSRECIICNYWYFLEINFRFDPKVCNSCHVLMQKFANFNVVIVTVKENDYRINFLYTSEDEAIDLLRNAHI